MYRTIVTATAAAAADSAKVHNREQGETRQCQSHHSNLGVGLRGIPIGGGTNQIWSVRLSVRPIFSELYVSRQA